MAFAPPVKGKTSSSLAKSSWTPMNHPEANIQVFEERRELIKKWFQKWQDKQKRIIVDDILRNLSTKHLISLNETLNGKFPQEKHDFTRILPRVLTLYLFSFLDPRTLCRCAQVSWYWNYLTEMDCLWRPKCLKFGWYPTYQPSPFEEKIWKRFYVNTVHQLNFAKAKSIEPKYSDNDQRPDTARSAASRASVARSTVSSTTGLRKGPTTPSTKKPLSGPKWEPPPWKGSDPHPIDTMRYNYLDNMSRGKKKKSSGMPDSRPTSKQSRRPQSAVGGSRQRKEDGHGSPRSGAPFLHEGEDIRKSVNPPSTRLTTNTSMPAYGSGTIPSPRLNRDFELPQYNGHDNRLGMSTTMNQYGPGYSTINSQIKWPPQQDNRSVGEVRPERPTSSYTRGQQSTRRAHDNSYSAPDITHLSIDAGVRPQPVAKFTPEKTKQVKEKHVETLEKKIETVKTSKSVPTSNTEDLKGKGWEAPTNSNSDDEDV